MAGDAIGLRVYLPEGWPLVDRNQSTKSQPEEEKFLNNAPIYWTSKKQGGIETSSFASLIKTNKRMASLQIISASSRIVVMCTF